VDSPKHREFVGHIATSGRLLLQIISDILDLSKIESGKFQFVRQPARLKQALCNYVSAAITFTPGGRHVVIRVVRGGTTRFRIEVEDDGIGISEPDLPKLFSEFHQLDAGMSKQHQGTGLGLALTRRWIEAQGGRVGVRGVLGRGSTFYLELERIPVGESAGPAASAAPRGTVS
jgi:signal transduction histidine kinase